MLPIPESGVTMIGHIVKDKTWDGTPTAAMVPIAPINVKECKIILDAKRAAEVHAEWKPLYERYLELIESNRRYEEQRKMREGGRRSSRKNRKSRRSRRGSRSSRSN